MTVIGILAEDTGELLATDRISVPGGHRWTVTGQHGTVAYDSNGNQLALLFVDGEIDSAGDRWADQAKQAVEADDDAAVYELLAGHYERALTAKCIRCHTTSAAAGVCCSSHEKRLCHLCYRRTHFVEVCVTGCRDCAAESLPVKLADLKASTR